MDSRTRAFLDSLLKFDDEALPLRIKQTLPEMVQMRIIFALLYTFFEDLKHLRHPTEFKYEFLTGPTKILDLGGRIFICKAFTAYSQFQLVDESTFQQVSSFRSDFNRKLCDTAFEAAKKDWPLRRQEYIQEERPAAKLKLKEALMCDWLLRLKHTAYLINLASNLTALHVPPYVVEASIFVHSTLYMGGTSFFLKRFPNFTPPSPEAISSFRCLWPETTSLLWHYDGSPKTFPDPQSVFRQAIRSLDLAGNSLANTYDIGSYIFFEPDRFYTRIIRPNTAQSETTPPPPPGFFTSSSVSVSVNSAEEIEIAQVSEELETSEEPETEVGIRPLPDHVHTA